MGRRRPSERTERSNEVVTSIKNSTWPIQPLALQLSLYPPETRRQREDAGCKSADITQERDYNVPGHRQRRHFKKKKDQLLTRCYALLPKTHHCNFRSPSSRSGIGPLPNLNTLEHEFAKPGTNLQAINLQLKLEKQQRKLIKSQGALYRHNMIGRPSRLNQSELNAILKLPTIRGKEGRRSDPTVSKTRFRMFKQHLEEGVNPLGARPWISRLYQNPISISLQDNLTGFTSAMDYGRLSNIGSRRNGNRLKSAKEVKLAKAKRSRRCTGYAGLKDKSLVSDAREWMKNHRAIDKNFYGTSISLSLKR